jgi:hypothetical protein
LSRFQEVAMARITRAAPHLSAAEVKTRLQQDPRLVRRVFPSLEELIEVMCQALVELAEDNQRLRSMMFFPHFRTER